MTIRILHAVGNDPKGAVIETDDRRAQRLILMGYAEAVKAKKAKDQDAATVTRHRV